MSNMVEYYHDETPAGTIEDRVEIPAMELTFQTVYPGDPGEPEFWHTEKTEDGEPIPNLSMPLRNKEN